MLANTTSKPPTTQSKQDVAMASFKSLIKSKKRVRDAGEVFTPDFLVEQMLDGFPKDAWAKDKNWLEPTCGNGNFVVAIIRRKLRYGFRLIEALNTTFGMDIMQDNIDECHRRIFIKIVKPYLRRVPVRQRNDMRVMAVCIVINNFRTTKDSLEEDWNAAFSYFDDLPSRQQMYAISQVSSKLEMVAGRVSAAKSSSLYQELLVFREG
jgi:hypothetical protein